MAYYSNENDEEQQSGQGMNNPQEGAPTEGSAPVQLSNRSSASPSDTPQTGTKAPKPAGSGMSPGFQNYTKANQGTAQNRLNSAVSQNVANVGKQATNATNQATSTFGKQVDAGSLANRENAVADVAGITNAARASTAPAPVASPTAAQDNATAQPTAGLNTDRFKEVINAQYKGPESLRQAGLYQLAAGKVGTAQNTINQTGTAGGREDLLKGMYQNRANYTTGLNKLDSALLNSSTQGVQNLQNTAKAQGNLQGNLDKAQINSANLSQNRGNEIKKIQEDARTAFTSGKKAEEAATEERLSSVVQNWEQLPEHFRNIIRNKTTSGVTLSPEESAILGIGAGEGLYNLGADAIKSGVADKTKLISKDEQYRQAALANLAGLDASNRLDTNLLYGDAAKAGTQTAYDALDLAGTRSGLNAAEKQFQDYANAANLTGYGAKKNKTSGKTYYSQADANLGDLLRQSGYNFGEQNTANNIGNADLLKNLGAVTNISQDQDADGQFTTLGLPSIDDIGNSGQSAAGAAIDSNPVAGGINMGLNLVGGKTIGQTVSNIFGGGANSAQSKQIAKSQAQVDLDNKLQQSVNASGFNNRFDVGQNAETDSRMSALQSLLANLDKTNA